nr:MAG TPA: hypothetical protein [Caudoviricetes sp.]
MHRLLLGRRTRVGQVLFDSSFLRYHMYFVAWFQSLYCV